MTGRWGLGWGYTPMCTSAIGSSMHTGAPTRKKSVSGYTTAHSRLSSESMLLLLGYNETDTVPGMLWAYHKHPMSQQKRSHHIYYSARTIEPLQRQHTLHQHVTACKHGSLQRPIIPVLVLSETISSWEYSESTKEIPNSVTLLCFPQKDQGRTR